MPTAYFLFPSVVFMAVDANGDPSPGAKAYVYEAGTSTPLTVYTDSALTTPHASPIVADANGVFAPVYISGADVIKIDVTNSAGTQLPGYPVDNITGTPVGGLSASGVVFTPTATLAATDVQTAVEALDDVSGANRTLTAGLGLTGGGTLAADRSFAVDEAGAAGWRAATADKVLIADTTWDAAAEVTLTDAATIAVDMSTFLNAVVTLGGNRTLGNPTNTKVGQSGVIRVVQDGTGTRTLAFGTSYEFAAGTAPVMTTTAAAEDLLFYHVISSTRIYISFAENIS